MKLILLIEDDKNLCESLSEYLRREGFEIQSSGSLADGKLRIQNRPSLIVLDWMLPDGQGLDFLKDFRKVDLMTPVILLTSRAELVDKVVGLEAGANDYITKPFEPRELVARIRSQLRTSEALTTEPAMIVTTLSGISIDQQSRDVKFRGKSVELTKMEFHLLDTFIKNPNRVFPRKALLNEVWGYDNFPTTRTIDNHVLQLRQKFLPSMFETVRGVGYRFRDIER